MKSYVCGFMFNETAEHIALIRKLTPEWQKGFFNGIGGKVELREGPNEAMVREYYEEAGVLTKRSDWDRFLHMTHPGREWEVHFYRCFDSLYFQESKTTEMEMIFKFPMRTFPWREDTHIKLVQNLHYIIPMAANKEVFSCLMTAT